MSTYTRYSVSTIITSPVKQLVLSTRDCERERDSQTIIAMCIAHDSLLTDDRLYRKVLGGNHMKYAKLFQII